jgi:DNA-binding NtrC family response regulator
MDSTSDVLDGKRILVVEDEYILADDLAMALREAGASTVGPVASVGEAVNALRKGDVHGAIIDMNLRGEMAGDLAQRLKRERVPCVIVSGYSEKALPEAVRDLPRLEKPISNDRVVRALKTEIERARTL